MNYVICILGTALACFLIYSSRIARLMRHQSDSQGIVASRHKREIETAMNKSFMMGAQHTASLYDMLCETVLPQILEIENRVYGHNYDRSQGIKLLNPTFRIDHEKGTLRPLTRFRFCGVDMSYVPKDKSGYDLVANTPFMEPDTSKVTVNDVHPSRLLNADQVILVRAIFIEKKASEMKVRNTPNRAKA